MILEEFENDLVKDVRDGESDCSRMCVCVVNGDGDGDEDVVCRAVDEVSLYTPDSTASRSERSDPSIRFVLPPAPSPSASPGASSTFAPCSRRGDTQAVFPTPICSFPITSNPTDKDPTRKGVRVRSCDSDMMRYHQAIGLYCG